MVSSPATPSGSETFGGVTDVVQVPKADTLCVTGCRGLSGRERVEENQGLMVLNVLRSAEEF